MKNSFSKKNNCIQCEAKFSNHDDLVVHVRHEHHDKFRARFSDKL
jgi:hypothetical protein